jgi:hypothetical protein
MLVVVREMIDIHILEISENLKSEIFDSGV